MRRVASLVSAFLLVGCIQTKMEGYADRDLPARPLSHMVAYVSAPVSISNEIQASLASQASTHGLVSENALAIFPPTRAYSEQEIKRELLARGVDGVLLINVGDTGVLKEYTGTVFSGTFGGAYQRDSQWVRTGNTGTISTQGTYAGGWSGSSQPEYMAHRSTRFVAKLIEPSSNRILWTGEGQVRASGLLFVGDQAGATSTSAAIFNDLQAKGLLN
jgi:hypothetical protein